MQLLHDAFGLAHINLTRSRNALSAQKVSEEPYISPVKREREPSRPMAMVSSGPS